MWGRHLPSVATVTNITLHFSPPLALSCLGSGYREEGDIGLSMGSSLLIKFRVLKMVGGVKGTVGRLFTTLDWATGPSRFKFQSSKVMVTGKSGCLTYALGEMALSIMSRLGELYTRLLYRPADVPVVDGAVRHCVCIGLLGVG